MDPSGRGLMSDYFCIRYVDGRHQVGMTSDGRDFIPLPRAAFGNPRDAIRYAEMRQMAVSPLRGADDVTDARSRTSSSVPPSGLTTAGNPAGLASTARSG